MIVPPVIFVVEDDQKTSSVLCDYLHTENFEPVAITNGLDVVAHLQAVRPKAILLDLNLPGLDGVDVCRAVRAISDVPIIMISARVDELDRLLGLEIGADDYICKPFSPREVMARLAANIRRAEGRFIVTTQTWHIVESEHLIKVGEIGLNLTPVEFRLLMTFLKQPGRIFSRDQLLDRAHKDFRDVSDRAIDGHIKNIRRKLKQILDGADPLESVYGVGYRFSLPAGVKVQINAANE